MNLINSVVNFVQLTTLTNAVVALMVVIDGTAALSAINSSFPRAIRRLSSVPHSLSITYLYDLRPFTCHQIPVQSQLPTVAV